MKRIIKPVLAILLITIVMYNGYQLISYYEDESRSDALNEQLIAIHICGDENEEETDHKAPKETAVPLEHSETKCEREPMNTAYPVTTSQLTTTIPESEAEKDKNPSKQMEADTNVVQHTEKHNSGLSSLQKKNSYCIAWISIPGTVIDYPVMHTPDNPGYYLHRNFYGKKASGGTLFLSEICDIDRSDNLIIYGHNMKNGTMFAALTKYKTKSFWEEHPYITLETADETRTYEVICALATDVSAGNRFPYYDFSRASSAKEFDSYVAACKRLAYYDTGVTAEYGEQILTLSTCEYTHENGRLLVIAKRIE